MLPTDELSALSVQIADCVLDERDSVASELIMAAFAEHGYTKDSPMSIEISFERKYTTVSMRLVFSDDSIGFRTERVTPCRVDDKGKKMFGASILLDAYAAMHHAVREATMARYLPNRDETKSRKFDDALYYLMFKVV